MSTLSLYSMDREFISIYLLLLVGNSYLGNKKMLIEISTHSSTTIVFFSSCSGFLRRTQLCDEMKSIVHKNAICLTLNVDEIHFVVPDILLTEMKWVMFVRCIRDFKYIPIQHTTNSTFRYNAIWKLFYSVLKVCPSWLFC